MPLNKPWEFTDEDVNSFLKNDRIYIERQVLYWDLWLDENLNRFDFSIPPGTTINMVAAALTIWLKERTGAEANLHYYLHFELNASNRSYIIFYREDDAAIFKLAFADETMEVNKEHVKQKEELLT